MNVTVTDYPFLSGSSGQTDIVFNRVWNYDTFLIDTREGPFELTVREDGMVHTSGSVDIRELSYVLEMLLSPEPNEFNIRCTRATYRP